MATGSESAGGGSKLAASTKASNRGGGLPFYQRSGEAPF